VKTMAIKS